MDWPKTLRLKILREQLNAISLHNNFIIVFFFYLFINLVHVFERGVGATDRFFFEMQCAVRETVFHMFLIFQYLSHMRGTAVTNVTGATKA